MSEVVEWKQRNLEAWYQSEIDTMEKAVTVGLVLKDVGERCEIAIGKLANHVEKGKWGGGITAFAEGIGIDRSTIMGWMVATATPELVERSTNLGTSKVAIVERAPMPESVWDWIDALEEVPTVAEIKAHLAKDDPMARCRALSEASSEIKNGTLTCYEVSKFIHACDFLRVNGECPDGHTMDRHQHKDRRFTG